MDPLLVAFLLFVVGIIFGLILFVFILLPLFYTLPHLLVWTMKKYLEWRTPFVYLFGPILWILILFGITFSLALFIQGFNIYLANSHAFGAGLLLAVIVKAGKATLSETVQREMRRDVFNYATPYLTPKGAMSLRGLWTSPTFVIKKKIA